MLASFEDQTYTLFNVVLLSLIQGISRGTMQERDELYLKRDKALKRNLLLMTDEERDIFDEGEIGRGRRAGAKRQQHREAKRQYEQHTIPPLFKKFLKLVASLFAYTASLHN